MEFGIAKLDSNVIVEKADKMIEFEDDAKNQSYATQNQKGL